MRHLAPYLEKAWGQPVLIDNRPGGGSMVGTAQVAQAKPDGQTLLVTTSAYVTAPAIQPDLPFDPREDLIPVANVGDVSYILVTNANSDFDTLDEFVAASKERPKFAATAGLGTTTHFAIEKFIADSGADVDVVHFKGGGPAVVSILSGRPTISRWSAVRRRPSCVQVRSRSRNSRMGLSQTCLRPPVTSPTVATLNRASSKGHWSSSRKTAPR